jgi:hypothetical protein
VSEGNGSATEVHGYGLEIKGHCAKCNDSRVQE